MALKMTIYDQKWYGLTITKDVFLFFGTQRLDLQDKNSQNLAESSPRAPATSLQVQCDPLEPVHCKT